MFSISNNEEITPISDNHYIFMEPFTTGIPATTSFSIPHSLLPLLILKNPLSPQSSFQEFATNQKGVPCSTPQPIILTE